MRTAGRLQFSEIVPASPRIFCLFKAPPTRQSRSPTFTPCAQTRLCTKAFKRTSAQTLFLPAFYSHPAPNQPTFTTRMSPFNGHSAVLGRRLVSARVERLPHMSVWWKDFFAEQVRQDREETALEEDQMFRGAETLVELSAAPVHAGAHALCELSAEAQRTHELALSVQESARMIRTESSPGVRPCAPVTPRKRGAAAAFEEPPAKRPRLLTGAALAEAISVAMTPRKVRALRRKLRVPYTSGVRCVLSLS